MQQSAYTPTEIAKIGPALDSYFEQMGGESAVTRGNNSNFLVPISSLAKFSSFEITIEELVEVHPSRFFLIVFDSAQKQPSAGVSARCKLLGKGEHLCAELIKFSLAAESSALLPSMLQANLVSGTAAELFLFDADLDYALVRRLVPLVDTIFFDAALFEKDLFGVKGVASYLLSRPLQIVDLRWLALAAWRDSLRDVFAYRTALKLVPQIRSITLRGGSTATCTFSSEIWLTLGWIKNSLGLGALSRSPSGFQFGAPGGTHLECRIETSASEIGLTEVRFEFADGAGSIELRKVAQALECRARLGAEEYLSAIPCEAQSQLDLLKQYFLIGVSTQNYRPALQAAAYLYNMV